MILFIALPKTKNNSVAGIMEAIPLSLLPRRCPVCQNSTIIGHGQRHRPALDDRHERIWVRRGICRPCHRTFTILPDWLAPSAPYSLHCRQQADQRIAAGACSEQAALHCQDPSRLPDPSTLRRWASRRRLSLWCWIQAGASRQHFLRSPTIVAWDLSAYCRTLLLEAKSP